MTEETERKLIRIWAWSIYAMTVIYLLYGVYLLVNGVDPR